MGGGEGIRSGAAGWAWGLAQLGQGPWGEGGFLLSSFFLFVFSVAFSFLFYIILK